MAQNTGGRIIAQALEEEGVDTIFGIIDGSYLHLFATCVDMGMKLVTPRHETTAMHMAGAYARLTGRLGVAIASNGPGVANVLSGVAVENAEGNRVLLITSSRRTGITYPDRGGAYQCFDQVGVIGPMAKWSASASSFERIPEMVRKALRACYEGRPGVVHLDVPEDLMNGDCDDFPTWEKHQYRSLGPIMPSDDEVAAAADILAAARLPIIHAGSGVIHAGAFRELEELADILHSPVSTSWSARGVLPETHELAWPMVYIDACNALRNGADAVLCLGSRLGETDWWGKPPNWAPPSAQKLIQVDIDPSALGRNRPADLLVRSDIRAFLVRLIENLKSKTGSMPIQVRHEGVSELAESRDAERMNLDAALSDTESPMLTAHVGAVCREVLDDDAVVVFDGGNTAVWANAYWRIRTPNTQLGTWHMGHLGAGPGQALGAAVARPDAQVCCIIGDGAMGFHPQEIETAVRNGLKVIFVVCSDKQWGMVKTTEIFAFGMVGDRFPNALSEAPHINGDLGEILWDDLARSMGAHGERVADPAELGPALKRCIEADTCSVIHVDVDPTKHMFAPGLMHFKQMHQEPAGE
ncbi:MAG: thiamine pyrophosphate-binding protein [Deltaproteobacteria bacterium]|nr:thiamine pyrophosphate-binding protein [Deltaproteobacteria bacterium]